MPRLSGLRRILGSSLRRNVLTGVGTACVGSLVGMISYPIYLHFLGYERYGIWIALSTVLTFAQLGNFGINPALSKLVAAAHGSGDMMQVQRYLTTALLTVSVTGLAVFLAVLWLRRLIVGVFNVVGPNADIMLELLPYVALFSVYIFLVECLNATLVGLGRMDLENWSRTIAQAVALASSAVFLHFGYGISALLAGAVLSYLVMHAFGWYAVRSLARVRVLSIGGCNFVDFSRILGIGGWVFGASVVSMAFSPVNRVVLSRYAGIAVLPVYEIAFNSSMRVRSLLESGLRALLPEVSRLTAAATRETADRLAALERKGFRIMALMGGPLYATAIALAPVVLQFWLRGQNQPILTPTVRIMLLGSFCSLMCVPGYYLLLGLGRAKACFVSAVIQGGASLCTIGMSILLTGSTSISYVSMGVLIGMALCSWFVLRTARSAITDLYCSAGMQQATAGIAAGPEVLNV